MKEHILRWLCNCSQDVKPNKGKTFEKIKYIFLRVINHLSSAFILLMNAKFGRLNQNIFDMQKKINFI